MTDSWQGRFPQNDIISLLEVNRPFNLAESTAQDLSFGELVALVGYDNLKDVRLGYGSAQGLPALRAAIGQHCGVPPEFVVTTHGTALALYLLAIEVCRPGNHKRETIAFSKRHQGVVERAAVLLLWLNFSKPFSENHGGGTPAMRIGIREKPVPVEELLKERLFPSRVELPSPWREYYYRLVPTVRIKNPRRHTLKLAV